MEINFDTLAETYFKPAESETLLVDTAGLRQLWRELLPDGAAADDEIFDLQEALSRNLGPSASQLNARSGGWRCHLRRGLLKSLMIGPIVATLLAKTGDPALAVKLVSMVLPFLFDLERTSLSRRNEQLLLHLVTQEGMREGLTPEQAYEKLPTELQSEVHRLDFLDVLDALKLTGHAEEKPGNRFVFNHPQSPKFTITFS